MSEETPDTFADCEVVVSQEVVNQRVAAAPLEVRAAAAAWEDGRLTVWIPNQGAQGSKRVVRSMLGLQDAELRLITPDVGGAFGAKFGADAEHAVVALAARHVGRPVRWAETRSENLVGMTHGRAQVQTVTIGGRRDGTHPGLPPATSCQDSGAYPQIGGLLPTLTMLMAPGVYDIPDVQRPCRQRGHQHDARSAPTAAPAGRRPPRRSSGRSTCSPPRSAWTRPRCAGRNLLAAVHRAATRRRSAPSYDSGDYAAALDKVLDAAGYARAARRAGGAGGQRRRRGSSASGCPATSRSPAPAPRRAGPSENATVEVHPDGTATDPHRHLAARPGPRDRVGDAGQRRARHPGGEDHRRCTATPT